MKFSVSLVAHGDREMTLEEIVELADAVAPLGGIASGMGTTSYGAQIMVEADNSADAVLEGQKLFAAAVAKTTLPQWEVTDADTMSEDEDFADLDLIPE
jgi:hypothetical protein